MTWGRKALHVAIGCGLIVICPASVVVPPAAPDAAAPRPAASSSPLAPTAPAIGATAPTPGASVPMATATTGATPGVSPRPVPSAGVASPATPQAALPRPGEVRRLRGQGDGPPVVTAVPTRRKVVFLTIDDGWEQDPGFVELVRERRVPITVFAMRDAVEARGVPDASAAGGHYVGAGKWAYFRELRDLGVPIEDHTLTHPDLWRLGYAGQKAEICGSAKVIARETGRRPTLFRPPFGSYGAMTVRAAKACGQSAVVLWTASVQPGGKISYQTPDKRLHPGDILLMHFRAHLARDFRILLDKIERRGFELGDLSAYLQAMGVRAPAPPGGVARDQPVG
ncbi:polysaccharide deacetylase family protein [Sphaerisporangium corydalis]|uniref:Polysaccharide deacetylase family protein n=1 Tax=Sphaerisporangium corydalis TaxID=1441875 RepID=A0ABV9ENF0_9ACTN|nr:polysaccharide deacetylase family protein [Sphaerisporangium corydalis]